MRVLPVEIILILVVRSKKFGQGNIMLQLIRFAIGCDPHLGARALGDPDDPDDDNDGYNDGGDNCPSSPMTSQTVTRWGGRRLRSLR